jgi:hypothetical protein
MSRIRTIKPDFFRHEGLQDLERENPESYSMLVFAGLFTVADKNGRFEWKPRSLKLDILPFLNFDMAITLNLLEKEKFIVSYSVEEKKYGMIPTFSEHQRITGKEAITPGRHPGPEQRNTGETPGKHPVAQEKEREKEREEEGEVASQPAPSSAKVRRRLTQKTGAPDEFEISEDLKEWASKACPNSCLEEETEKFLDHHRAVGSSFKDWDAAWRKWMRNAAEWGSARNNNGRRGPATRQSIAVVQEFLGRDERTGHAEK